MVITRASKDFPYVFKLPKMYNQWEASSWCEEQFGPRWSVVDNRQGVWCCFWRGRESPGMYEWYFKNERDALMFMLKWM